MSGKKPPRVIRGSYWEMISVRDFYRTNYHYDKRRLRRDRRRRLLRWNAMSPEEQRLISYMHEELMREYEAEMDREMLYGNGNGGEILGLLK